MTMKQRPETEKTNKSKKKSKSPQEEKESIQLVAQEIKFARSLAGNDKKSRDKVLKTLRKWLTIRCESNYVFKEDDFNRIWKGLFYAMWMSDKPLVQEDLSESISGLLDVFPEGRYEAAMLFFKCGLRSLATEWFGLDQHRMDKFLMLVRRLLRGALRVVSREAWSPEAARSLADALGAPDALLAPAPPAYARNALALSVHVVECFAEELAKVSGGDVPEESLVLLLGPMARLAALAPDSRLAGCAKRHVFVYLLRQSELGSEYEEKKQAWIQMGCPEGGVDCLEPASDDEEDPDNVAEEVDEAGSLDPRAGRVDALVPRLPVPASRLAALLRPLLRHPAANTRNKKRVKLLVKHLEEYSGGEYPLRAREAAMWEGAGAKRGGRVAPHARRLHEFEKRTIAEADELAIRGLSRKHRKRVLARARERLSEGDAEPDDAPLRKRRHNDKGGKSGEWKVEELDKSEKSIETKTNKRKNSSALADEVPLKKLKNILKEKEEKANKEIVPDKTKGKVKEVIENIKEKNKNAKSSAVKTKKLTKAQKDKKISKTQDEKKISKIKEDKKSIVAQEKKIKSNADFKHTPKKVTIVLKNNTAQGPVDYYKSVQQSPNIPFDSTKKPTKTNLKPNSTPSPINPFFKRKLRLKV